MHHRDFSCVWDSSASYGMEDGLSTAISANKTQQIQQNGANMWYNEKNIVLRRIA